MKSFKQFVAEEGMGGGAMSAAPTNTVGTGNVAGSGGAGGEPGVNKKKKGPILMKMSRRNSPKV